MPKLTLLIASALMLTSSLRGAEPTGAQIDFFEKKIRPVLVEHCYQCHADDAKKVKGGLLLDTRADTLKGGDTGPAVVPGDPGKSLILKALRYEDDLHMPPAGKLSSSIVEDFTNWIKSGAADPRFTNAERGMRNAELKIEDGRKFWAFQQPRRYSTPPVSNTSWPLRPIDNFILARLEQAGMQPAAQADRVTWLRRVYFDLIGLPPTPEDVADFLRDCDTLDNSAIRNPHSAFEKVVERLLSVPQYGERWARVWLDVARFAEDQAHIVGNDASLTYPNAYLFRDWVIGALNSDLPYDQFVKLQLAADVIRPDDTQSLAALGFLGLGPKYYNRNNPAVMADEWEDRVDVVGRGLLGLTVACARCHDHKFDPIPTTDYYGLAGVFAGTEMFNRPMGPVEEKKPDDKKKEDKSPKASMHVVREGKPTDLNVYVRGDVNNKGPLVKRHFLTVLSAGEPAAFKNGSGRVELAEAIANRHNPLTARVIVNRVWAQYFGRGIVATPSNFGQLGERPTHPELLDDLAVRFMEAGWSLKWLHREIALSATYRQSVDSSKGDPENKLLGRMSRRRLPVESWRDSVLVASGQLERTVGGKSIDPQDPKATRRTVYSAISRLSLNRLLAMFDHPDANITADRRVETTTPLQKLFVMNSPFMVKHAEALAARLANEVSSGEPTADKKRIERAYQLLFGRAPTAAELKLGLAYINDGDDVQQRWQRYAHVLLASNEMMYLD